MQSDHLAKRLSALGCRDHVCLPDHPDFEQGRRVWNGMIDRRPAAIARPGSAKEVAELVLLAQELDLALSVRGGGHSFPGFSTCEGGLVVDLSRLKGITVDPVLREATAGGGALLGDLDRATAPHGLVAPAGVVSHTGAGGLTLGGGMGWTSRRFGLTIDNLLEAELVTADGQVRLVSEQTDPELFWGLRGGGGNFGIVTRFRYRLHELGPITVGKWLYPPSRLIEALGALEGLAASAPRSVTLSLNVAREGLTVTAFHSGAPGGEALVLPFGQLAGAGEGGLVDCDFLGLQSRGDIGTRWGRRYYSRGGFAAGTAGAFAETALGLCHSAPAPDCELYAIQLGGAVADVPDEATAYPGRAGAFYWIVMPIWDDPGDDERCLDWGRSWGKRLEAISQGGNYINELGEVGREVTLQAFGPERLARLSRLKARVDPTNLFRLNQNIQPAH